MCRTVREEEGKDLNGLAGNDLSVVQHADLECISESPCNANSTCMQHRRKDLIIAHVHAQYSGLAHKLPCIDSKGSPDITVVARSIGFHSVGEVEIVNSQ